MIFRVTDNFFSNFFLGISYKSLAKISGQHYKIYIQKKVSLMSLQSSYQSIAEQIVVFNNNIVELLSKLNSLTTSPEPSVNVEVTDNAGVQRVYSLPSFSFLSSEISRLNNNINAIYGLDGSGSLVQPSNNSSFRKIVSVEINKEPVDITNLNSVANFSSSKNWFFDGLLSPQLFVTFDLEGKIDDVVDRCLVRRYIISFEKTASGSLSNNGQLALNSFNLNFRQKTDITQENLLNWMLTTPGVMNSSTPEYDEQVFDLEPNFLLYDGTYTVIKAEEDVINKRIWYHLNTLDYTNVETSVVNQLSIGDELIVNLAGSSTKYKILEVSLLQSNPRIRVERSQGFDPVPIGFNSLKIHSSIRYTKRLRVSIGYDERCVVFTKAISGSNGIQSKNWSLGSGFWTNDLILSSSDNLNGTNFETFYASQVYDYGKVLTDLVAKKIPNQFSVTSPASPELISTNFRVVQINSHLTDQRDSEALKNIYSQNKSLQSEIDQLSKAILEKTTQLQVSRFSTTSDRDQWQNEINRLGNLKETKTQLFRSNVDQITSLNNTLKNKDAAKYRLRGFWPIPQPVVVAGSEPQEVVQFRIQYRYLSIDGSESPVQLFRLDSSETGVDTTRAIFSNWIEYKSDVRKRIYNTSTGEYTWQVEDVSDAETPNINQIDIPIQTSEKIEFRIKSISEVGWPESPVESEWSQSLTISFPDDLSTLVNESDFLMKESTKDELKVSILDEFSSRGVDTHLADTVITNDRTYLHRSENILSGFKDNNGISIDLYSYLQSLENKIKDLESRISRTRAQLSVVLYRNNEEFVVANGSELVFNIECEDYAIPFTGKSLSTISSTIPTGRVYANNIYVIKDFLLQFKNTSIDSPLGILSSKQYSSGDIYDSRVPQVIWVNDQDEILVSNTKGVTNTQLDYQYLWSVNYTSLTQNLQATKLSDNIGNDFLTTGNNSLTDVLSSNEFNLGYGENALLNFVNDNTSLFDPQKWIDQLETISSETKLLSTCHPMIPRLENLVESNAKKIKEVTSSSSDWINISLPIYFKLNSLDNVTKTGENYEWISLNNLTQTVKHTKRIKFYIETNQDARPFVFTITFNLNRNKVIVRGTNANTSRSSMS